MANLIDTDAKDLGTNLGSFGGHHIIKTSGGRLYALQINISDELEIYYSDNNGSSWILDTTYTPEITQIRYPTICKDSDDNIYIAYVDGAATGVLETFHIFVQKRDSGTNTWSEVLDWSLTNHFESPTIAMNFNRGTAGRLHLFIIHHSATVDAKSVVVKNKYSDNEGETWSNGTDYTVSANHASLFPLYDLDTNSSNSNIYIIFAWTTTLINYIFTSLGVYVNSNNIVPCNQNIQGAGIVLNSTNTAIAVAWDTQGYIRTSISEYRFAGIKPGSLCLGIDPSDNLYIYYTLASDNKAYLWQRLSGTWQSAVAVTDGNGYRVNCEKRTTVNNKINFIYFI